MTPPVSSRLSLFSHTNTQGEFSFTRSGTFTATPSGDNHCGPKGGPLLFHYSVTVHTQALDQSGFVMDGNDIGSICENPIINCSCEQRAAQIGADIYHSLKSSNLIDKLISISVTLGGQPNADATWFYPHVGKDCGGSYASLIPQHPDPA